MQSSLKEMFSNYMSKDPVMKNKDALKEGFTPGTLPHREKEIGRLGQICLPALRGQQISNVFIYGKTGTGKTLVAKYVTNELAETAAKSGIKLKVVYLNANLKRVADTEYRLLSNLIREFGVEVPSTGLPTEKVYNIFYDVLDREGTNIIVVLDEIDRLIYKCGDELMYNLTRINAVLKNSKMSIIGITNDLKLLDNIDARVRSSLGEEEMVFTPYDANQLKDILSARATAAFKEGSVDEAVIAKCAAYAAREHGDARRALDLLRVSGEVAERLGSMTVGTAHVDQAMERLETDSMVEVIKSQPQQSKAVLYSIMLLRQTNAELGTGEVYNLYSQLISKMGQKPLTQRRVSDLISELGVMGIINANVVSKGRYGRTREIGMSLNPMVADKVIGVLKSEFAYGS